MRVEMRTRQLALLTALAGLALAGCSSIGSVTGSGKDAPDEFAVVTKQPLIIPPEFNLHPPRPGAAPINQVSPTDAAENALFPDDPNAVAATIKGDYSPAEKLLLASTGAANASDSIRQQIAADNRSMEAADESFTNSVLFGTSKDGALDADAEKARLDRLKASGKPVARARPVRQAAPAAQPDTAYFPGDTTDTSAPAPDTYAQPVSDQPGVAGTLPDLDGSQTTRPVQKPRVKHKAKPKKEDDGWLDGIF